MRPAARVPRAILPLVNRAAFDPVPGRATKPLIIREFGAGAFVPCCLVPARATELGSNLGSSLFAACSPSLFALLYDVGGLQKQDAILRVRLHGCLIGSLCNRQIGG